MILAIDFDGVLHNNLKPVPGRKMGYPIEGAQEYMLKLRKQGHILIVHTLWATTDVGKKACEKWLHYWDIPYSEVTNRKPRADIYLDNKALRFINWPQAYKEINHESS